MGVEIERKFLVNKEKWEQSGKGPSAHYRQGYMVHEPLKTIRIRLAGKKGYITIKGPGTGLVKPEYEYEIPEGDAKELLDNFCISFVSKIRYKVVYKDKLWEVDEFLDANEGLIMAEIELQAEAEQFELPPWAEKEVTEEKRYSNKQLSINPYRNW